MADEKPEFKIGNFRLGSFLTGPLNWENHLKVVVFAIIILIWACVWHTVSYYLPHKADKATVGTINSGGAPVDNSTKKSFWSLFYFGGQNQ